jgi:hypothetical protein
VREASRDAASPQTATDAVGVEHIRELTNKQESEVPMSDAEVLAWLDQEDARVAATIRRSGWFIQYVGGNGCGAPGCGCDPGDGGPPFAYTVGLFGMGHPELVIFGVSPNDGATILNTLGERIRAGDNRSMREIITRADVAGSGTSHTGVARHGAPRSQ